MPFADLHCHPAAPAYDNGRLSTSDSAGNPVDTNPHDPWQIPQSDLKRQDKAKRAFGYSQSDPAKSSQADALLVFAALYPTEKGFFFGNPHGIKRVELGMLFDNDLVRRSDPQGSIERFVKNIPKNGLKYSAAELVDQLQSRQMNYSKARIDHIQSGKYDYFEELIHEYNFYKKLDGKQGTSPAIQLNNGSPRQPWSGTYHLANPANISQLLKPNGNHITYVLTIEGMHALGVGNDNSWENVKDISGRELLQRIDMLKGNRPLNGNGDVWQHRPFFITFSHHFNNRLCGHAHSIPNLASKLLFDQTDFMNQGFTPTGIEAVFSLLGLDSSTKPTGSPRILIDVKHMSAKGRKQFYDTAVKPFNQRPENAGNKIPIIASHAGYSGVSHLHAQIDMALAGEENDNYKVNGFYAWNINLTNEDVIEIHNSEGLMGLSFDQRILGQDKVFIAFNLQDILKNRRKKARQARQAMKCTIEAIVNIPFENNLPDPHRIWSEISIGTDFDGFIDPLFNYPTVLSFQQFEQELVESLEEIKKKNPKLFEQVTPVKAARKICYENAHDFVLKHYR